MDTVAKVYVWLLFHMYCTVYIYCCIRSIRDTGSVFMRRFSVYNVFHYIFVW